MLIFAIILTVMSAYLIVGANYSRNRYATIMHNQRVQLSSDDFKAELVKRREVLAPRGYINHAQTCKSRPWSSEDNKHRYCNCGVYREIKKIDSLQNGVIIEPKVLSPMLAWPVYKAESFLKGGQFKGFDPYITDRLEKELGIGELE